MVASQRCLERARPTPFDAHQFEGRPPHKTQPQASAPPTAPKRASGLLDAGPLPHLEHHRRPHPRPLELGYIPTPLLTHQDNLGSYVPTGYTTKRRDHPAACGLPWGRGPYHRAGRLSDNRPSLPPRRHGLSRSDGAYPARLVGEFRDLAQGGRPAPRPAHHPRRYALPRTSLPHKRHPVVWARILRRPRRGAWCCGCKARDSDAPRPGLAQRGDRLRDGGWRGFAADLRVQAVLEFFASAIFILGDKRCRKEPTRAWLAAMRS